MIYMTSLSRATINPLKCYQCNKVFINRSKLDEHNHEEHNYQ